MCGIVGIINKGDIVTKKLIKKMTDTISHRGPDGEGHWIEKNIGIGHRRLSVIDLSHFAKQPMQSLDERYVLSYNGELYNYNELKKTLKKFGYKFKSQSDTEVVLYSLIHWGKEALKKFNGMFALCLWDKKNREFLLARDRYGVKPLYYTLNDRFFAFSSEQKSMFQIDNFNKELNCSSLSEYFTFQNFFSDKTLLKNIHILPAGHYAKFSEKEFDLKVLQYWDFNFQEPTKIINENDYNKELDFLFKNAVQKQLIGDVELGAYLSGGIDSGSITALASKKINNIKSFTCGFDLSSASGIELTFDERNKAEAMSAKFKTEHYEMVLKAGDMERCMKNLSWHIEEPRVGQSYPIYYAAKLASKFVKVVLSGTGGDELFGGYPWRYFKLSNITSFDTFIESYFKFWQRMLTDEELKNLFLPIKNEFDPYQNKEIFRNVLMNNKNKINRPEDYINNALYLESKTFLHGLLVVEDKLSMAHGLETRVPFMDNDLVEFAMKCPVSLKLKNLKNTFLIDENSIGKKTTYFQKTNVGKQILRNVMKKYVPKEIVSGKKQGFSSPDASWFKGESINFVKKIIFNKNSLIYNYLDYKTVTSLVQQHVKGLNNRRLLIWSLISFEFWIKNNLDN